jgi:hypothetical protein
LDKQEANREFRDATDLFSPKRDTKLSDFLPLYVGSVEQAILDPRTCKENESGNNVATRIKRYINGFPSF